jgi:hypothetical protein
MTKTRSRMCPRLTAARVSEQVDDNTILFMDCRRYTEWYISNAEVQLKVEARRTFVFPKPTLSPGCPQEARCPAASLERGRVLKMTAVRHWSGWAA